MKKKILMVDDEPGSLFLLEALLNANGLETAMAENGKEALAMARLNPPDLIVSDILMPVMDGYTLCREWKLDETLRSIPFVFYTAEYTRSRERALALSLDPDDFILKPQEPHILIRLLIELLEKENRPNQKFPARRKKKLNFFASTIKFYSASWKRKWRTWKRPTRSSGSRRRNTG